MRPQGWVVDMRHYLDEETGDIPDQVPSSLVNLVLFFGSIVAWVTDHLPEGDWHTNVSVGAAQLAKDVAVKSSPN